MCFHRLGPHPCECRDDVAVTIQVVRVQGVYRRGAGGLEPLGEISPTAPAGCPYATASKSYRAATSAIARGSVIPRAETSRRYPSKPAGVKMLSRRAGSS